MDNQKNGKSKNENGDQNIEQLAYLRSQIKLLKQENKRLKQHIYAQKETNETIKNAIKALPSPSPLRPSRAKASKKEVVACMVWSDWHIGEIIRKEETEGFGEYNYAIAKKRLNYMIESFTNWVDVQRKAYKIDKIVILGLGDYISGLIHDELLMNQEFPPPVQAVKAGSLLAEGVQQVYAKTNQLDFYGLTTDNHGRIFRKPMYKKKGEVNLSYVTMAVAKESLSNFKNLNFNIITSITDTVDIVGFKFLIMHGDGIRSWMGIPYYGIERLRSREAIKRMHTEDKGYHYLCMGHWHAPGKVPGNIFINGSLSGTSEFDHGCGRVSEPAQIAFLVHPKHGAFNYLELTG